MKKILITTLVFVTFFNNIAFAYLDPGTGSIILQLILAGIAAGAAYCSVFWEKIKKVFYKRDKRDKKD